MQLEPNDRGLILVQDPALRSMILPLFAIDERDLSARPEGRGTTFRISPWGACVTAYHVIEELLEARGGKPALRDDVRLVALEQEGMPYGTPPVEPEQWRTFKGMYAVSGVRIEVGRTPELRNMTELATLQIPRSSAAKGAALHLGVDLRRWRPTIGDRVTAYGFAGLDVGAEGEKGDELRPISQHLYRSSAPITDIEPADPRRGRPWPFFRIDRDWPGGMSGGPVVNEGGHVVGVVSTGISFAATGLAVFFSGSVLAEKVLSMVDPGAPGQILCWGGFDQDRQVAMTAPTLEALMAMEGSSDLRDIRRVSFNTRNGDYVLV